MPLDSFSEWDRQVKVTVWRERFNLQDFRSTWDERSAFSVRVRIGRISSWTRRGARGRKSEREEAQGVGMNALALPPGGAAVDSRAMADREGRGHEGRGWTALHVEEREEKVRETERENEKGGEKGKRERELSCSSRPGRKGIRVGR